MIDKGKVIEVSSLVSAIGRLETGSGSSYNKLKESLSDNSDYDSFLRTLLSLLVEVIPIAEERYKQSPTDKNAKALTDLVNMSHVIVRDMFMNLSYEEMVSRLDREVLQSMQREMLSSITLDLSDFNKRISGLIDKKSIKDAMDRLLEELVMSMGISLKNSYSNALAKVRDIFTGGWNETRKRLRNKNRGSRRIDGSL